MQRGRRAAAKAVVRAVKASGRGVRFVARRGWRVTKRVAVGTYRAGKKAKYEVHDIAAEMGWVNPRVAPKSPPPPFTAAQLRTMDGMGFQDTQRNKIALSAAKGEFEMGVDILETYELQQMKKKSPKKADATSPINQTISRGYNRQATDELRLRSGWIEDMGVQLDRHGTGALSGT
eukprot:SAG22_NODE_120_length_19227_cov_7.584013_10_plen_176_part_00